MDIKIKLRSLKEGLEHVDVKNIHHWNKEVQLFFAVIISLIIFTLGLLLVFFPKWNEVGLLEQEEVKLKQEWIEKKTKAINLNQYREQLAEIEQISAEVIKQLPDKSQVEQLLLDINHAGVANGLRFNLFKPGRETMFDFHAKLPIEIEVVGNFNSIGRFIADVANLSRIVVVQEMVIEKQEQANRAGGSNDGIVLSAKLYTFRHLDEAEVKQQQAIRQARERESRRNQQRNRSVGGQEN